MADPRQYASVFILLWLCVVAAARTIYPGGPDHVEVRVPGTELRFEGRRALGDGGVAFSHICVMIDGYVVNVTEIDALCDTRWNSQDEGDCRYELPRLTRGPHIVVSFFGSSCR